MILHNNVHVHFGNNATSIPLDNLPMFDAPRYLAQLPEPFNKLRACLLLKQTHGIQGRVFTDYEDVERYQPTSFDGDYLITPLKNVGLAVATADCLPVVLHDTRQQVIALIHAGWRGSVAGLAAHVVRHMQNDFGTQVADVQVAFGPGAGVCCYEVGEEFTPRTQRDGKYYFDNRLFNARALEQLGVAVPAYEDVPCTICDTRFCSYRREGKVAARQLTIIALV